MFYLIGGENIYESTKKLKEVVKDFVEKSKGSVKVFNADEIFYITEITSNTESLNLFGGNKLFVIKRISQLRSNLYQKFNEYLTKNLKGVNIIIWDDKSFDKRMGIYKLAKKKGIIEEFEILKYYKLKSWIEQYLKKMDLNIDYEATEELIYRIGSDQMQLANVFEIIKLYLDKNKGNNINKELIRNITELSAEESIWNLMESISQKNKKKSLQSIENLIKEKGDFPVIISMLARQLKILAMTLFMLEKGKSGNEISKELGMHPYVIKKAIDSAKNFKIEQLKKLYDKLIRIDFAVKEGRFEEKIALDLFVLII